MNLSNCRIKVVLMLLIFTLYSKIGWSQFYDSPDKTVVPERYYVSLSNISYSADSAFLDIKLYGGAPSQVYVGYGYITQDSCWQKSIRYDLVSKHQYYYLKAGMHGPLFKIKTNWHVVISVPLKPGIRELNYCVMNTAFADGSPTELYFYNDSYKLSRIKCKK